MKADLQKHTLNLRLGDWAYLESVYKPHGVDTSTIVRTMVSTKVDELRALETKPQINLQVQL